LLFSHSVVSNSLQYHGLQHAGLSCPSPSPGVCSNSCPLSQWCHPTISSSVALFSCSQSFPASRYFPMSKFIVMRWPKYWSFSFSISLFNEYSGLISFRIDWISLWFKGLSRIFSSTTVQKHQFLGTQPSLYGLTLTLHMTTGKTIALTWRTFVGKVISLVFNMLSRFVIAFLPRSKCLLISWLQSPSAVILEPKKITSVTASIVSPSICHEVVGLDAMILVFWMSSFKPAFFTLFSHLYQEDL